MFENPQNINIGRSILETTYPSAKIFNLCPILLKLKFYSYFFQETISSS